MEKHGGYNEGDTGEARGLEVASYDYSENALYYSTTSYPLEQGGFIRPVCPKSKSYPWFPDICLVKGSQITLADNTTKNVEDITYSDVLKTSESESNVLWLMKPVNVDSYCKLIFDDDSIMNVSRGSDGKCHRLYCVETESYECADDIIGKTVKTINGTKKLVRVIDINEPTTIYNIITNNTLNFYADGVLTSTGFANSIDPTLNRSYDEFAEVGISEQWYNGLDLQHTNNDVNTVKAYINKLESLKQ
mgnify:CR=1 FL=1